jgi:hypothetical protein
LWLTSQFRLHRSQSVGQHSNRGVLVSFGFLRNKGVLK